MAINALAEAERTGKEVLTREVAIATASAVVTHPFRVIDNVQITRKTSSAPALTSSVFTWQVVGNVLTVYAWRPTSATDPTLIAGNAASTVSVTVTGRRR